MHSRSDPIVVSIKVFVALAFFYFAYRISRKSKTTLNRCFVSSFMAWGMYNILDTIVFVVAPINGTWFIIANVLWRLQLLMIFTYAYFFYNTASIVSKSGYQMFERSRFFPQVGLLVAIYIVIAIYSGVSIESVSGILIPKDQLPPSGEFRVNEGFDLHSILFAVPLGYFIIATFRLGQLVRKLEGEMKSRVIANLVGNLMIPVGLLYFLARSFLFEPVLITSIIGQLIFFISPFLIYYSQRPRTTDD
mgnify:CR=1 FL=1